MAKKIVLGKAPESFKRSVTFPMLDGSTGGIECEFKYRTRLEFGALLDETFAVSVEEPFAGDKYSAEKQQEQTCRINGKYIHQTLKGWNLDVPLSEEACIQLAAELPAAAQAIMDAYRAAVVEGRLGN